jgi:hypothetical protein
MKSLTLYSALLLSLLLPSCVEDDESGSGVTPKLEMYFFEDCNQAPVVGQELMLELKIPRVFSFPERTIHGPYVTNSEGYVKVELAELKNANEFLFKKLNGEEFFGGLYSSQHVNNAGSAAPNAWVTHIVTLINTGETTTNDTLYLGASRDRIDSTHIGPFLEGYTFERKVRPNLGLTNSQQYLISGEAEIDFFWGIGRTDFYKVLVIPSYQVPPNVIKDVPQTVCGQGGEVIIDLRDYPK